MVDYKFKIGQKVIAVGVANYRAIGNGGRDVSGEKGVILGGNKAYGPCHRCDSLHINSHGVDESYCIKECIYYTLDIAGGGLYERQLRVGCKLNRGKID